MDYTALAQAALEKRADLIAQIRTVNDDDKLSDAEKRERIEKIDADVVAAEAEARGYVEQGEREAEVRDLTRRAGALPPVSSVEQRRDEPDAFDLNTALRELATGEARAPLNIVADLAVLRSKGMGRREVRAAGVNTAITTDSAWAGSTATSTFMNEVLKSLREHSPILQYARVVTTDSGEKLDWPLKNGNIVAAAVAEGATYTKSKGSFTRWTLDAHKYGVIAEATVEMLNNSSLPLAQIVAEDIGEALADATAADYLRGNGTTAPQGIVPATTLAVAIANAAAFGFDPLINLQHTISPKYRANAKFYMSDDAVLKARLIKDAQGRYIYQDAVTLGAPATLLGKEVVVDVNMDIVTGAGKVPVLFGDLSKFIIRVVNGVEISRSDEYGWDSDIVAWKGRVRTDSGLSDAAAVAKMTVTA